MSIKVHGLMIAAALTVSTASLVVCQPVHSSMVTNEILLPPCELVSTTEAVSALGERVSGPMVGVVPEAPGARACWWKNSNGIVALTITFVPRMRVSPATFYEQTVGNLAPRRFLHPVAGLGRGAIEVEPGAPSGSIVFKKNGEGVMVFIPGSGISEKIVQHALIILATEAWRKL